MSEEDQFGGSRHSNPLDDAIRAYDDGRRGYISNHRRATPVSLTPEGIAAEMYASYHRGNSVGINTFMKMYNSDIKATEEGMTLFVNRQLVEMEPPKARDE